MDKDSLAPARILVVDDHAANILALTAILEQAALGTVTSTTDPRQVVPLVTAHPPDLILLDLMMPHLDGFAVLAQLQTIIPATTYLPILMLTADNTTATRQRALASGATDFLTKPLDSLEVVLRSRNLLATRRLHCQLREQNDLLEARVAARTRDLERAQLEILERLARAVEYRDDETGQHTRRVGQLSAQVAGALGLPPALVTAIARAAPLHDVGKIGIPDQVLGKRGRLTPTEIALMQTHTTLGGQLLADGESDVIRLAQQIVLTHHERWDGTGYPRGLAGEAIPLCGRIVAVTDVFDALTHARPYKPAWPLAAALDEIRRQRGHQFDPQVVTAFLQVAPPADEPVLRAGAAVRGRRQDSPPRARPAARPSPHVH
ncbi:MAG TPA: HD domain-containing phosphohydrolase [Chloroflexia bacterium]|nr:HD domain-containing phosphohydrolase [Chloroflexia bacterium]